MPEAQEQTRATHTPGPWQFYADLPSTEPNWHIVTNESRLRVVANVHIEPGNSMDLANARLIAAAPDLLAACERIRTHLRWKEMLSEESKAASYLAAMDQLDTAIPKAK